jgi:hypothetical protein
MIHATALAFSDPSPRPGLPPAFAFEFAAARALAAPSPAQQEFASLEAWLSAPPTLQLPLHQIEGQQEQRGREVQRLLLQAHIQQRGQGVSVTPYGYTGRAKNPCFTPAGVCIPAR